MSNTNQLILKIESKVLSTNIADFEKQSKQYLSSLSNKFETDEDFAQAEAEIKELKALETATKQAIDEAVNGSADVSKLIESATAITEQFRQARLEREKLVKAEKEARREAVINDAVKAVEIAYTADDMFLKPLQASMPFAQLSNRIAEAAKNKRTIDSIQKSVNAEANACIAEISAEMARLKERYAVIPKDYMHLFQDALDLIVGTDDLQPIIDERIAAETKRREAEKARIKAEAQAKAQREAEAEKARIEAQAKANAKRQAEQAKADTAEQETVKQPIAEPQAETTVEVQTKQAETDEPQPQPASHDEEEIEEFVITITVNTYKAHAIALAREIKARYGDSVKLNKGAQK